MMMAPDEKRGVHFYKKVRVYSIPSIDDMTLEDRSAAWYSAEEYSAIKKRERKRASRLSSKGEKGERHALMKGKIRRQTAHHCGKYSVLMEQMRQWEENDGFIDPELLAELYSESSKKSVQESLDRGRSIALQVRRYNSGIPSSLKKSPSKETMVIKKGLINQRWEITVMDSKLVPTRRHPSRSPPNGFLKPRIQMSLVLSPFKRQSI
jgi:hypothetical protein